jgi:hypothetical protein
VENINWRMEIAFAGVATIIALIVAAILRDHCAGKWPTSGASGAIGGLAASVVIA